jgi:hypothetical protein
VTCVSNRKLNRPSLLVTVSSRSPTAEIVGLSLLCVERAQPYEGVGIFG